jgi:hypothetical protein
VEGYSAELVERALRASAPEGSVFDPFGGSGTTALAAALLGRDSLFAEVNPYLAWIADVKVNQARRVAGSPGATQSLRDLASRSPDIPPLAEPEHPLLVADRKRGYFPPGTATRILGLLASIDEALDGATREVARLAVATSLIPASLMVRRTDLRKRKPTDPPPLDLGSTVASRLLAFAEDIERHGSAVSGSTKQIACDVRGRWEGPAKVAVIVTSPPYLNGTNYCRNTKLELLALRFMSAETDLRELRTQSISAGINNISRRRPRVPELAYVEPFARQLDSVAYDARIPALVRGYFADMRASFSQMRRHAVLGARMYLDIGDSRYCGVYVPTHELLSRLAESEGWHLIARNPIRDRRSYDGSALTQVLLQFEAC